MRKKQWLAGLLAAAMLASLAPASLAAEAGTLTRGEARDILIQAAADYGPGVTSGDILKGDETGALHEDRAVTRGEALVMLERAFGGLPTPVGDNALSGYPAGTFTDVPDWAAQELQGVLSAGIVAGTGADTLSPNDPITAQQLDLYIRRVYALEGTELKDDFYAAVNKQWLDSSVIPAGQAVSGTLYDLVYKVNDDVAGLITDIAAGEHAAGTGEQKIAALYNNILDWNARNKAGIAPLRPYLDAIDSAQSLQELLSVDLRLQKELYTETLLGFGLTVDLKDSTKYTESFSVLAPGMSKDFYANGTEAQTAAYLTYLTTLLKLGGVEETEAARQAEGFYQTEKTLAGDMLSPQEQADADKIYNIYTMDDLKALFPGVDLDGVYSASGLKGVDSVVVMDVGLTRAAAALLTDENTENLKVVMRVGLLRSLGSALNRAFTDAAKDFNAAYLGVQGTQSDEEAAAVQVQSLMSDYLGQAYVDKFFSAEAKADVEDMIREFIAIYKERIEKLDWMSGDTKAMAVKKLDSMGVKVGYPDQWDDYMDAADIKSAADGGSFFSNLVEVGRVSQAEMLTYQGQTVDKSRWICPAFTVNAFYNPAYNDITFPAGILQSPMYDVNASREQNLGSIGYAIAHEITHAFDNNGAKFDEKGNAANWWSQADYAAFQERCAAVTAWYDGQEAAPGITCSGALTLSENVADLGAAACVTQAAGLEKDPDYDTLYRAMAQTWCATASRAYRQAVAAMDVHAQEKLRVNRVLQTVDQFYETFGIGEGDGMWVAPADRVSIW